MMLVDYIIRDCSFLKSIPVSDKLMHCIKLQSLKMLERFLPRSQSCVFVSLQRHKLEAWFRNWKVIKGKGLRAALLGTGKEASRTGLVKTIGGKRSFGDGGIKGTKVGQQLSLGGRDPAWGALPPPQELRGRDPAWGAMPGGHCPQTGMGAAPTGPSVQLPPPWGEGGGAQSDSPAPPRPGGRRQRAARARAAEDGALLARAAPGRAAPPLTCQQLL